MSIRVQCLGKCGIEVMPEQGECRKCRKTRRHAGLKRLAKLGKNRDIVSKIKFFFASRKEQFQHSKTVYWNRPKQVIRGLHIRERRRNFVA